MPRTIEITLKVKLRKPRGDEIEEMGFDREEVREFDLGYIEVHEIAEEIEAYFDNEECIAELLQGTGEPVVISSIQASAKVTK